MREDQEVKRRMMKGKEDTKIVLDLGCLNLCEIRIELIFSF